MSGIVTGRVEPRDGRRAKARHNVRPTLLIEQGLAILTLFMLGLRLPLHLGITVGYALSFALLPLTLTIVNRFWGARWLVWCVVISILSGLVLASSSGQDHVVDSRSEIAAISLTAGIVAGVLVLLWARNLLSPVTIALVYGLGMLASVPRMSFIYSTGSWKFGYSVPISVLVLAMAWQSKKTSTQIAALLGLAAVSAATDARSMFAIYVLASGLLVWARLSQSHSRGQLTAGTVIAFAGIVLAMYNVGQMLLVRGFLGQATQERSIEQIQQSGSILLGGRPELAATAALMKEQPLGFGLGVWPNLHDVSVSTAAMRQVGSNPSIGGLDKYMFYRGQFELHSIFGNLWALYGVFGLILAGTVLVIVLRHLSTSLAAGTASGLMLFVSGVMLWNIFCSPLWSSEPVLILCLGLCLARNGTIAKNGRHLERRTSTSLAHRC